MSAGVKNMRNNIRQLEQVAGRAGSDTIRLWESYKEQAYLWRAMALLQLPATLLALVAVVFLYISRNTIIEVPEKPLPGYYSVRQLPDAEFINVSSEIVNSIASYTSATAEDQFRQARKFLWEPALSQFEEEMIKGELKFINNAKRSQLFVVNRAMIVVTRFPDADYVAVRVPGIRYRAIGQKQFEPEEVIYYVRMTTIPRNVHNQYGIVITDMRVQATPLKKKLGEF